MSHAVQPATRAPLDVAAIRAQFPILSTTVRGRPLVYLDNAATSQKPRAVLDAERAYYETTNANVHRGVHRLSEQATAAYEGARAIVRRFLGARADEEIVFVRGTTEAINLVAFSFVAPRLAPGDEIVITHLEHHSNIVPWQLLCGRTGAVLRVAPIDDDGQVDLAALEALLASPRARFLSIAHVSNALGTVLPVADIVRRAHAHGVPVMIDGAQAAPHLAIDVQALGCDFYAFSSHKVFGPTGIGALYARREHLEAMPPWQGGGDMIASVSFTGSTWNRVPYKFEAGTPNIAGAVGLGAALEWLMAQDLSRVLAHEHDLLAYGTDALSQVKGLRLVGTARDKASVLSFVLAHAHPHDVGTILDQEGIAIRTGHHCAQPVMERFGIPATAR
ncbi:MAG: SufS family cysteine desulfurase, partial [Candidatus Eisenbacteria bacterium]